MDDYNKEYQENLKTQQKIMEIENVAKRYMSGEAISRYGALKSAHPQKAIQAIALIAQLGSQNEIPEKINDEQFKNLLLKLEPEKKETKIIRK